MIKSFILQTVNYQLGVNPLLPLGLGAFLESLGIPFAGTTVTLSAGSVIAKGEMNFLSAVLVTTLGNVTGSSISYGLGYLLGSFLRKKHKDHKVIKKEAKVQKFIQKYGSTSAFFGQLYGTTRTFISFPAGVMKVNFKKFIFYTALGGLIFSVAVMGFSVAIKDIYDQFLGPFIGLSFGSALLLFLSIYVLLHFSIRIGNHYGKRLNSYLNDKSKKENNRNQGTKKEKK